MLVYGDQQDLRKVGLCGLLNTKDTIKRVGKIVKVNYTEKKFEIKLPKITFYYGF